MKTVFYKILIVFSIALLSVLLCIYYMFYADYEITWSFEYVNRISKNSDPLNNTKTTLVPNSLNIIKIRKQDHNFMKGTLKFDNKILDIFLHNKNDYISQTIISHGMWETGWINQLIKYLKENPGMQLIDAGCNLGVYTLVAAALGHKVIAIDANKNNTDRLAQSVLVNNLTDKVTILLNALSNERKSFSMNSIPNNIGGQELVENTNNPYVVQSIFLDDLLPLVNTQQDLMMKMDIQFHEIRALKAASNIFDKTNIKLILIEWVELKNMAGSYTVMGFLLSRNYTAHQDFYSKPVLAISNYQAWPYDVVWRRN